MSNYRVAVRYAKSLLEFSIEKDKLEKVTGDIQMIHRLCQENRSFLMFLKNPIIHSYKKQGILKKIFKGKLEEITFAFMEIITRKSREDILPEIAEEYLAEYRKFKKIEIVEVQTPIALDDKLLKEFEKLAGQYIGKGWTIEMKEKVNEELIGGYVLKIGDKQIDSSVSSKLRDIRKELIVS